MSNTFEHTSDDKKDLFNERFALGSPVAVVPIDALLVSPVLELSSQEQQLIEKPHRPPEVNTRLPYQPYIHPDRAARIYREPSIKRQSCLSGVNNKEKLIISKCHVNEIDTIINPCMHPCLCVNCSKDTLDAYSVLVKHIDDMLISCKEVGVAKKRKTELN